MRVVITVSAATTIIRLDQALMHIHGKGTQVIEAVMKGFFIKLDLRSTCYVTS